MQVISEGVGTFPCTQALLRYRRVIIDATYGLGYAGPEDHELGTLRNRHIVTGLGADTVAPVVFANAQGTRQYVANGAITIYDTLYGAEDGKVQATANGNPIGIALAAATADDDIIEGMPMPRGGGGPNTDSGGLHFEDDFIGDYPAKATALTGNCWTKVETDGLGVISSDEPNGVLKFVADAVDEASTQALYMVNAPFDIDQNPIVDFIVAIFDIGDETTIDFNFGVADDTHADNADTIAVSAFFHLDGADLSLCCECDDNTTDTPAEDTGVDLTDDTYYEFRIDMTDKTDVKFSYRDVGAPAWTRLLPDSTFSMAAATGALTPIVHVEKAAGNDTTFDLRLDKVSFDTERT